MPKEAWKTINDLLGRSANDNIVNELKINDSNITSTEEIANAFNEYFTNIGPNLANSIGDANSSFETFVKSAKSKMDRFKLVSVGKVVRLLNGLSNGKAVGLDKISGKILKAAASTIAPSLTHIFNNGLISNCFPYEWKMARLVPIHKKGPRNLTENYRPISILPAISKIMERIMYDQIYQYLTDNSLLSEHQFGFRKYHSTASALLDSTNSWYVNMDRKMFNLVVLLDLKKAFDTIDHGILLRKLELYGIAGSALALIRSYFSDRNQKCQLGDQISTVKSLKKVTSGIGAIRKIRDFVNRDTLISIYNALINPHFDYCSEVWDTMGVGLSNRLQKLQNRAARVIMNFSNDISGPEAIKALGWESLETRRAKSKAKTMYKVLNNLAPSSLAELFEHKRNITKYDLRGSSTSLQLPQPKTEKLKKSFSYDGAKLWNSLPVDVRNSETLTIFKERIRAHTVQ